MTSLRDLARELPQDEMRTTRPFDNEFQQVQERILATAVEEGKEQLLGAWLSSSQPCLFGRLAARNGQLQYCFLSSEDLKLVDHYVSGKIAAK